MAVDKNAWSIRAEKSVVDNNIDWGTVASKVTTELETIRDERQTRKDAIDEATNSMMNELAKGENINNATLSTALIDGGQSASEALQIQVNLMKKGLIKPKDYKIFLQKQQNAYTNLKNVVQNWDKWETKSGERSQVDPNSGLIIASQLELDFNESTSAFGNMENIKFIPTETGGMEAVRLIESPDCTEADKEAGTCQMVLPNRQDNPDNFMNPNVVGTRQNFQLNRLNLNTAMKSQVDALGAYLETSGGAIFKSVNDFRESDKYQNAKNLSIDAVLAGGDMSLANLAGNMGYRFAQSEAQKQKIMEESGVDASKIIMYTSTDGNPKFAKGAFDAVKVGNLSGEDAMREYVGDKFDAQLADETKLTKGLGRDDGKQTREEAIVSEKEKALGTDIRNLNNILTSDDPDYVQGNLEGLIEAYNVRTRGKGKYDERGIVGYTLTDDKIQFKYANGDLSIEIARKSADGDDDPTNDKNVGTSNQIYQLGVALDSEMFQNQVQVDDWIAKNEDFKTGEQRGITLDQANVIIEQGSQTRKDLVEQYISKNPKLFEKDDGKPDTSELTRIRSNNPAISGDYDDKLRQFAFDSNEDSLDVDFQMKDYNYDDVTSPSGMTTVNGSKTPGENYGGNELRNGQMRNFVKKAVDDMLPIELKKDLESEGATINVELTEGTTSTDGWDNDSYNGNNPGVVITFTTKNGEEQTFVMDAKEIRTLTGKEDVGALTYPEYAKILQSKVINDIIKPWGKKYRGSKRGQSGGIGRKTKLPGS